MIWLLVLLAIVVVDRPRARRPLQQPRPAAEPRRQLVGADRGAAEAALGPDPEPHRDGQGLRRPRARDLRSRDRGARTQPSRRRTPAEAAQAEGILGAALGRLFAVAEAYPELQADENFRQLQTELAETENRIAVSRQVYNDSVLTLQQRDPDLPGPRRSQGRSGSRSASSSRSRRRHNGRRRSSTSERLRGLSASRVARARASPRRRARADVRPRHGDVRVQVAPDGSVSVEEAITVSFDGLFTFGFREVPYRDGERIDGIVGARERRPYRPGASTELEPGGPPGTFGVARPRRPHARSSGASRRADEARTFTIRYRFRGLAVALRRRRRREPARSGATSGSSRSGG